MNLMRFDRMVFCWPAPVHALIVGIALAWACAARGGQTLHVPDCGLRAVRALAAEVGAPLAALATPPSTTIPDGGFSVAELCRLGSSAGVDLRPVRRFGCGPLPYPSIAHWKEGHFVTVLRVDNDEVLFNDGATRSSRRARVSDFLDRSSGVWLAQADRIPAGWQVMRPSEAADIRGGLIENVPRAYFDDDVDQVCPTDEEPIWFSQDPDSEASPDPTACPGPERCPPGHGDGDCGALGMPRWHVSEPFINLWVKDVPLYYTMSNGRILPFTLRYRQRNANENTNVFGFGKSWECSWLAYGETNGAGGFRFRVPGGGRRRYADGTRGLMGEAVALSNGGATFFVTYRSACILRLEQPYQVGTNTFALLSAQQDPYGRTLQFRYETNSGVIRLKHLIDYDGRTNFLAYGLTNNPRLVTAVTNPYGAVASLGYDANGNLIQIVDMQGLTNQFEYDAAGLMTRLVTPYGTTRFSAITNDQDTNTPIARGLLVTLPDGATNLFAYREWTGTLPDSYTVPKDVNGDDLTFPYAGWFQKWNSFAWNSQQLAATSNNWTNLVLVTNIAASDLLKARLRHWWWRRPDGTGLPTLTHQLLLERAPSPDGSTEGHTVWYDYSAAYKVWPNTRAEWLANGQSRYTLWARNEWGHPTGITSTYDNAGSVSQRFASYQYLGNDQRLLTVASEPVGDETGSTVREYAYNNRNQITSAINYVYAADSWTETTQYTYADHGTAAFTNGWNLNLTSITYPSDLIQTNRLDTDTFQATNRLWYANGISGTPLATNRFTWSNGKVTSSTDARGLTLTKSWDSLGRLTGVGYPDGSTISNRYVKLDGQPFTNSTGGLALLDRTHTKDRLDRWTAYKYDSMRRVIAVTNAVGNVTAYDWCSCGVLNSVTDPLGNATTYEYDLAGRLTAIHYPGANRVFHVNWSVSGEPTNLWDSLGSVTLTFNHQQLWTGASNSFGLWQHADYDVTDRATSVVAADGHRLAISYDSLGRVLQREMVTTNGASIESFGYTTNVTGAVAYTNQLGTGITLLAYDLFGRLTNQVLAGLVSNRFTYTAAGDMASLVDGKGQTTAWTYDAEGRAFTKTIASQLTWSNAYNANGWLTTHWTPARSNVTRYAYDAVGNVTSITNSSGLTPNVTLTYDQNNRLKTMADAAGNTTFTWSELGTLAGEDGPWGNDTISFGYNDTGLRQTLTLVQPNASPWPQAYAYDGNWRLKELTSPAGGFTNTFLGASRRLTKLALANGSVLTDTYDDLGRLLSTVLKNAGGGVLNAHTYVYDAAHQRISQTLAEGNFWDYGYDATGQLTGAQGREEGGALRAHEQLSYGYDAAGNLIGRTNNGFAQTFTLANSFNQLDSVSRSGTFTAAGLVQSATNVTVTVKANAEGSGTSATVYADKSFARTNITLVNGNNTFTAVATDTNTRTATNIVTAWLPATASFVYDRNGNLTSDGRRGFGYDDFDQLTSVTVTNAWRSEFTYDALRRRRVRTEKVWKNSQWVTASETRYVYDHMLVIQERDGNNLPAVTYTRGLDLSGGLQRAGGIGGLLALTQPSPINPQHFYYHADAGGNLTALTDSRQAIVARYRYDPFGNLLGLSGPMAEATPYRFSSKEFHANSGLYHYGYRFYEPSLQRWLNRDPLGEAGGINLYGFVGNGPTGRVDGYGLFFLWRWIHDYFVPPYSGPDWMNPDGTLWYGGRPPSAAANDYSNAGEEMDDNDVPTVGYYKRQDDWRGVKAGLCAVGSELRDAAVEASLATAAGALVGVLADGVAAGAKPPCAAKGLAGNPFKRKTPQEIGDMLAKRGYVPKGTDPVAGQGTFLNPKTGRSVHIDANHPPGKPPHVGVHRPRDHRNLPVREYPSE